MNRSSEKKSSPLARRARWLLVAFSLLLALGFAEVAVRILAPQASLDGLDFLLADDELGWRHQPNVERTMTNHAEYRVHVRTDAHGLRISSAERPPGPGGLLALGDSYVFGFGVEAEQTLFARAASALGLDVANAGVAGYTPCQASGLGARLLDELAPRAVVLALFLGNDERETALGTSFWQIHEGALARPGWKPSPWRRLSHPVFESSHLLRLLRFSAPVVWVERNWLGKPDDFRSAVADILLALEPGPPPQIEAGDAAIAGCVPHLAEAARARGTPLLAVLIPDWTQVDPARLAADAAVAGRSGLDPAAPSARLTAILRAAGYRVFDLRPAISTAIAAGEKLYFPIDRHFTPRGHELAAAALREPLALLAAAAPAAPGAQPAAAVPPAP